MNHVTFFDPVQALLLGASIIAAIAAIVLAPGWWKVFPIVFLIVLSAGWDPQPYIDFGLKLVILFSVGLLIRWRVKRYIAKPYGFLLFLSLIALMGILGTVVVL